jgi:CheY-like chemotaxis protein
MGSKGERTKKILLAEDDPNDVLLLMNALERGPAAGNVDITRDGAEALDYLYCRGRFHGRSGGLPNLVLLDLKMPKVDGLEVLRQIRSDPELRFIPVVMLTSSRERRDVLESYRLQVNAYVVKPVGFEEFTDVVRLLARFWAQVNEPPPEVAEVR